MPSIQAFGLKFLVTSEWRPNPLQTPKLTSDGSPIIDDGETVMEVKPPVFGALPVIFGTAVSSALAVILAVPLSLGAALFLVRISPKVLRGPISFLIEFLAAHGQFPMLVFGVQAHPFNAHCWVQHADVVLNSTLEEVVQFTPMMVA